MRIEELKHIIFTFAHAHRGMMLLCVGVCMGWVGQSTFQYVAEDMHSAENALEARQQGQYKYINPLLECEQAQNLGRKYYKPTFDTVKEIINDYENKGMATEVGVYFRDLNNGPWYAFNEDALFEPASMFKLPLLVSLYKKREIDHEFFDQKVSIVADKDDMQNIKPSASAQVGMSYTVRELIQYMMKYSDNTAAETLFSLLDPKYMTTIFSEIGMTTKKGAEGRFVITVRDYSSIYRFLFNGSYLSRSDSEEILELLTQTEFNNGLRKFIPSQISIAHKFGERQLQDLQGNNMYQLHDCGIVYYPRRPFLLCVMTKGSDPNVLVKVIQDISRSIYTSYDEKMKNL